MKSFLAITGAALSLSGTVAAVGKAIINNKCDFDVYVWHVSSDHSDSSPTVLSAGDGTYSETFVECSSGGVSLKLSNTSNVGDQITQYEYTLEPSMVFYDLSNVNCKETGCPFQKYGMKLTPSSDCAAVNCPAGDLICKAAYTLFNDDWASHGCETSVDLTLDLCSDNSGSSDSSDTSGGYIGVSSASSSSAPASTTEAKVAAAAVEPTTSATPSTPSSTTLATSTKQATKAKPASSVTTPPAQFNEAPATQWVTEVAVETVQSTVIVTVVPSHEKYHKEKARQAPHPHARRHNHHHQ